MTDPVERLCRLAARAPELGAEGAWLAERLAAYLDGAETSLDEALGLRSEQGQRRWQLIDRRRRRDRLIRRLAAVLCPGVSRH